MKKQLRSIYFDTETTGISAEHDHIIEIAALDAETGKTFEALINPGVPIPPQATKVHGITDEMVADKPAWKEVCEQFEDFCAGTSALIAHNNEAFDKLFIESHFKRAERPIPDEWVFVDTLKWSRRYRPDLPRHALQFLREVYGFESNQAHRALDDVVILHKVFSCMIDDLPMWKVHELLSAPKILSQMPFGKHAGKPLAAVPKDYVRWLNEQGVFDKPGNEELKTSFQKIGMIAE